MLSLFFLSPSYTLTPILSLICLCLHHFCLNVFHGSWGSNPLPLSPTKLACNERNPFPSLSSFSFRASNLAFHLTPPFPNQIPHGQAGQSFLAFQRFNLGADSALFSQDYTDPSQDAAAAPYSAFTNGDEPESPGGTGSYQQPNGEGMFDGSAGYQRQDY